MKGIILIFTLAFMLLGAGVFFYETQVAAPRAGAIAKKQLANPKKNQKSTEAAKVASNSEPMEEKVVKPQIMSALTNQVPDYTTEINSSRIIDLNTPFASEGTNDKEQEALLKALDESVKKTIQESIRIDIQKAVASEISRQR